VINPFFEFIRALIESKDGLYETHSTSKMYCLNLFPDEVEISTAFFKGIEFQKPLSKYNGLIGPYFKFYEEDSPPFQWS